MENFTHFLLTKFNTKSFQSGGKGCDPEWLNYRFDLFDRFCFPSVCSQLNQNFKWLVFFDVNTPNEYKRRVESYTHFKNFLPIYLDFVLPYGTFPNELREVLQAYIDQSEFLITTWLDNDDAICQDYIQMIQNNFDYQESESINFISGYQLSKGKLYLDFEMSTHFISLIEKYDAKSFNTVLARDHNHLFEVCSSARNVICQPSWLEILHGDNVMNVYRKGIRVHVKSSLARFSIKLDEEIMVKDKELLSFLLEQIKIFALLPYSLARKAYFIIRHPKFNIFSFFHEFRIQFYPKQMVGFQRIANKIIRSGNYE
jgi:hypothetical protein